MTVWGGVDEGKTEESRAKSPEGKKGTTLDLQKGRVMAEDFLVLNRLKGEDRRQKQKKKGRRKNQHVQISRETEACGLKRES